MGRRKLATTHNSTDDGGEQHLKEAEVRELVAQLIAAEGYDEIISDLESRLVAMEEQNLELRHELAELRQDVA